MSNRSKAIVAVIALVLPLCVSAQESSQEQPGLVSIKRMTMETALKIAQAAIAQCRKEGVQAAVTVVDRSGDPQVMLRDVLTPDIAVPISQQKAHTATAFSSPTSALENRFKTPYSVGKLPGLMMSAGGVPVEVGGQVVGGVGVSGAPSGQTDEKCARAGVEAVQADLDMAGM